MANLPRTPSEKTFCLLKLRPFGGHSNHEKEAAKERQRKHGGTAPGRRKHSGKLSRSERTRDRIGAFAGVSGRSLVKIQAIVEAAERNPKRFAPLVADMDRNGRIDAAYRKLRQMQDEEQTLAVKPLNGKFKTLCIDPLDLFSPPREVAAYLFHHVTEGTVGLTHQFVGG